MKRLIDLQVPFFIPLWRRIVVILILGFWMLFEFSIGLLKIGLPLAALTLWCGYSFFIDFAPKDIEQ